jgi:mannan endo-1,4-beta-mannosidase
VASATGGPIDPQATPETRALLANLKRIAPDHVLFGHQDDLAYGVHWSDEPGRSDVKEVTGSYPAVYGWELGNIEHPDSTANLDGVDFRKMRDWIREGYARGGVITISWHPDNPATGGSAWDTTSAVATILPGGANHDEFLRWLDRVADFLGSLRGAHGEPIPVIFRPFHENSGSWFWWGGHHVTPEQFRQLWRMTVDYLRDEKGLHNLLYAYSTDVFDTSEEYLRHYPGDDYVDVMGYDDYQSLRTDAGVARMTARLDTLVSLAHAHHKLPALTETGLNKLPVADWWTGRLAKAIEADSLSRQVAYALVWRNATGTDPDRMQFFAPYPGQFSAADFVEFYRDPFVLFGSELPEMYR